MTLDFANFNSAVAQLTRTIADSSKTAHDLLLSLADLQAQLDALRIDAQASAKAPLHPNGDMTNA
jgi:hypothetical protein